MTTEELQWNAKFENESYPTEHGYNYHEEWHMERYYEDKELFERLHKLLKPAI